MEDSIERKLAVVLFNEIEARVRYCHIAPLISIAEEKRLRIAGCFFNADFFVAKTALLTAEGISKLLVFEFARLKVHGFAKRLYLLKTAMNRGVSITEVSSRSETLDENGKLDIPVAI